MSSMLMIAMSARPLKHILTQIHLYFHTHIHAHNIQIHTYAQKYTRTHGQRGDEQQRWQRWWFTHTHTSTYSYTYVRMS